MGVDHCHSQLYIGIEHCHSQLSITSDTVTVNYLMGLGHRHMQLSTGINWALSQSTINMHWALSQSTIYEHRALSQSTICGHRALRALLVNYLMGLGHRHIQLSTDIIWALSQSTIIRHCHSQLSMSPTRNVLQRPPSQYIYHTMNSRQHQTHYSTAELHMSLHQWATHMPTVTNIDRPTHPS